MKKTSRLALMVLSVSAMILTGCGDNGQNSSGNDTGNSGSSSTEKCPPHTYGEWQTVTAATELEEGTEKANCTKCNKEKTQTIPALGFARNVVIKNADGTVLEQKTYRTVQKITKPADPTAPAGKKFLGWKNTKNGGQLWDFDNDVLGLVAYDVELVPVFIDAGLNAQYLEAELCKEITAGTGWSGSTYSGGAQGKQLIGKDDGQELGSTCEVDEIKYYVQNKKNVIGTAPSGTQQLTYNPKEEGMGYFVHFNYTKGNTFTWNINVSEAVENVTLVARYSAEYGFEDSETFKRTISFTDDDYLISVNDQKLSYGTVTLTNIPAIGKFLPFQDYLVSTTVSLNAGANTITMKVNNDKTVFGTIHATAPCVDSLKLYTSATVTWTDCDYTNILE